LSKCDENNGNDQKNIFIASLLSLPPQQFTLLSSIIGIIFTENLNLNEQNSIGNFIVGVGQTILVAAAQGQLLESLKPTNNTSQTTEGSPQSDYKPSDSSDSCDVENEKDG